MNISACIKCLGSTTGCAEETPCPLHKFTDSLFVCWVALHVVSWGVQQARRRALLGVHKPYTYVHRLALLLVCCRSTAVKKTFIAETDLSGKYYIRIEQQKIQHCSMQSNVDLQIRWIFPQLLSNIGCQLYHK